jgi:hypothetical protein
MRQLAGLCSAAVICLSAAGCGRDQPVTRGLLRTVDTPTPSAKLLQQERTRTCIEAAEAEAAPQARRDTAAGRAYPSALASQRINHQPTRCVVQHRQGKGHLGKAVDELADDVAALVAKEQSRQGLNLEIGPELGIPQTLQHGLRDIPGVAVQVHKRNL